jgi:hypothetical protein
MDKDKLAQKLAIAATALLGSTAQGQEAEGDWEYSASILAYSEIDRVSAGELIFNGEKDYSDSSHLSFKIVLDALTGASANGAIEQNTPQTFTRPSGGLSDDDEDDEGEGQFITPANETPLDDTFRDTRVQINIAWTDALSEAYRYTVGSNLSKEYDYASVSVNGEIAKDLNQKNTTLSIGFSAGVDQYEPEGGIPIPFASMAIQDQFANNQAFKDAFNASRGDSSETISSAEALLGWTQVVNREMLMQFNYGFSYSDGYLNDPFKILSVVNTNGLTQDLVYESRPDSKTQHTFFGLMKYHLDNSILDVSYRYLTNDWDITSHTIDTHWLFFGSNGSFWEPHIRFYQQGAADFYAPFLVDGANLPNYASADYRVGEMTAMTVGLKYGFQLNGDDRAEIRIEYYKQMPGKANQPEGIANLDGLDLYPEIDAFILQFNYYF